MVEATGNDDFADVTGGYSQNVDFANHENFEDLDKHAEKKLNEVEKMKVGEENQTDQFVQDNTRRDSSLGESDMEEFNDEVRGLGDVLLEGKFPEPNENKNRRVTSVALLRTSEKLDGKLPKKEGLIYKWSPSLFVGWQQRYITLEDRILKYYKEEKGQREQLGVLNFDLYECNVVIN